MPVALHTSPRTCGERCEAPARQGLQILNRRSWLRKLRLSQSQRYKPRPSSLKASDFCTGRSPVGQRKKATFVRKGAQHFRETRERRTDGEEAGEGEAEGSGRSARPSAAPRPRRLVQRAGRGLTPSSCLGLLSHNQAPL